MIRREVGTEVPKRHWNYLGICRELDDVEQPRSPQGLRLSIHCREVHGVADVVDLSVYLEIVWPFLRRDRWYRWSQQPAHPPTDDAGQPQPEPVEHGGRRLRGVAPERVRRRRLIAPH